MCNKNSSIMKLVLTKDSNTNIPGTKIILAMKLSVMTQRHSGISSAWDCDSKHEVRTVFSSHSPEQNDSVTGQAASSAVSLCSFYSLLGASWHSPEKGVQVEQMSAE